MTWFRNLNKDTVQGSTIVMTIIWLIYLLCEGHFESNEYPYNCTQWSEKKRWRCHCKCKGMELFDVSYLNVCIDAITPQMTSSLYIPNDTENGF